MHLKGVQVQFIGDIYVHVFQIENVKHAYVQNYPLQGKQIYATSFY